MAVSSNFETRDLTWKKERPAVVRRRYGDKVSALRHRYYSSVLTNYPAAVTSFVMRTGGENWVNPNRVVGKMGINKNQSWGNHWLLTAYDEQGKLVGWADVADNVSSNRPLPLKPLQPVERFAKLHVAREPFISSRYGCIREIIGGDGREGFAIVAGSAAIEACFRTEQPLSGYPWDIEGELKAALTAIGLRRNQKRPLKTIHLGQTSVVEEPWLALHASDADVALDAIEGAILARDNAVESAVEFAA